MNAYVPPLLDARVMPCDSGAVLFGHTMSMATSPGRVCPAAHRARQSELKSGKTLDGATAVGPGAP